MADLQQRLALIAASQPARWPVPKSYAETVLRQELASALVTGNAAVLHALERVRDALGCPPDARVSEFLQEWEKRHVRS